jgi:hypothetical protein
MKSGRASHRPPERISTATSNPRNGLLTTSTQRFNGSAEHCSGLDLFDSRRPRLSPLARIRESPSRCHESPEGTGSLPRCCGRRCGLARRRNIRAETPFVVVIGAMRSFDSCVHSQAPRTTRHHECAISPPQNTEKSPDVFRDLRRRHDSPTATMHPPVTPSAAPSELRTVHFRVTHDVSVESRRSTRTLTLYGLGIPE